MGNAGYTCCSTIAGGPLVRPLHRARPSTQWWTAGTQHGKWTKSSLRPDRWGARRAASEGWELYCPWNTHGPVDSRRLQALTWQALQCVEAQASVLHHDRPVHRARRDPALLLADLLGLPLLCVGMQAQCQARASAVGREPVCSACTHTCTRAAAPAAPGGPPWRPPL